jgi:hypothetical protein
MHGLTTSHAHRGAILLVILVCVLTYLPAVDNFFIADDFGLFTVIEAAERSPRWFLESTTEFFRLMSYIYFAICWHLFGLDPQPYYWAGIGLHAAVAVLLYVLVFQLTRSVIASSAAALFFAAYERHQEAVMWISAANETVLALNCMVFLLLWKRAADSGCKVSSVLAHAVFALALFSKEAAVVLVPMAMIQLYLSGHSRRDILKKSAVLLIMVGAFGALWLTVAYRNFFVQDGHYALSFRFITVYLRTVFRLLVQVLPLAAAWFFYRRQNLPPNSPWKPQMAFFAALLLLSAAPYTFLTYLDHLPSRNTYFPSIGLAGFVGILFASLYSRLETRSHRAVAVSLFSFLVIANSAYVWTKKEPQYRERAAPTRELIETLNAQDIRKVPVRVCGFPLDSWTFTEAVTRFTRFKEDEVILDQDCKTGGELIVQWDQENSKYIANFD